MAEISYLQDLPRRLPATQSDLLLNSPYPHPDTAPWPPSSRQLLRLQDDKFSAQVASLEAEVRTVKAENAGLAKDNKACYNQIRAKDKQLDSAAREVEHARQTELHNKVGEAPPAPFAFPLSSHPPPHPNLSHLA